MEKNNIIQIMNNLQNYSLIKLCDIIICNKFFKRDDNLTIACMKELSLRRINGDQFDFENYIDNNYKEMLSLKNLSINMEDIINE